MKSTFRRINFSTVFLIMAFVPKVGAQPLFQNFDFENPTIVPILGDPFGRVEFGPAVPGWSGFIGDQQQTRLLFNNVFIGSPGIALVGPALGGFAGNYTLVLQNGTAPGSPDVSITQSGIIPAGTETFLFRTYINRDDFKLDLDGQEIPLVNMGASDNIATYGGDVSAFAGQTAELRITALAMFSISGNLYLDSLGFSTVPIPEPTVYGLLALGGLAIALTRWRNSRK